MFAKSAVLRSSRPPPIVPSIMRRATAVAQAAGLPDNSLTRLDRHVAYVNAAEAGDLREVEALVPLAAGGTVFFMNSIFMIGSE
jgi:hypothetical protein